VKAVDISTGLRLVVKNLETAQIPYMIVGSIAGSIYGEPRLTNDLDIVLAMAETSADMLIQSFNGKEFYVPPREIFIQEISRGGQTNLLHHGSGVKIDLMFQKKSPHALEEFKRRKRMEILRELETWIASPEDVIIAKLRFYREGESEKHLTDIRGILANTQVDREYLSKWVKTLDLEKYFAKV
jgi:hypothetical protein